MGDDPLIDPEGDLWISRRWLSDIAPALRPAEFMYLVWKVSGLPVTKIGMSGKTRTRVRRSLVEKELL